MQIPRGKWHGFKVALHQFIMPTVSRCPDGVVRMYDPQFLQHSDDAALEDLDGSLTSTPRIKALASTSTGSSQYKEIGMVVRPPLPPAIQPLPERREQRKIEDALVPSSSREKRTLATAQNSGQTESIKRRKISGKTQYFRNLKDTRMFPVHWFWFFLHALFVSMAVNLVAFCIEHYPTQR